MENTMIDLKNKTIIVTGSTGHLGFHIVLGLRRLGANIIAIVRDYRKIDKIRVFEENAIAVCCVDLSCRNSIEDFFNKIETNETPIHGLVNNAYFGKGGSLESMDYKDWSIGMEGSVGISFLMLQKSVTFLKKTKGSIVNIASMYGMVSPDPDVYLQYPEYNNPPNYGAGKAALIQLTKYASCYLARYSIRVNSISPGPFPNETAQKDVGFIARLEQNVPLGRIGRPEELVIPIAFLLSDGASYITGQNLAVDGGWTVW
jgi:NAD(P)-dependent dehydrogenase (short-subunit alcohol dehydrogenase family)